MGNLKELAILILIGGKSTRFGIEKPILELHGKSLLLHQLEILSKFDILDVASFEFSDISKNLENITRLEILFLLPHPSVHSI